jgi:predicted lipoprotein with Yx(FWY)xxD motif
MRRDTAHRDRGLRAAVLTLVAVLVIAATALVAGAAGKTATEISTTKDAKLGTILVAGTTVYTLKGKDCAGACLKTWSPVVLPSGTTAATAGSGVDDTKLGTKSLTDGSLQVTYDGAPLYWNAKDKKAGSVKGNTTDKYGKWSVVVAKEAAKSNAGTGGAAF